MDNFKEFDSGMGSVFRAWISDSHCEPGLVKTSCTGVPDFISPLAMVMNKSGVECTLSSNCSAAFFEIPFVFSILGAARLGGCNRFT